MTTEQLREVIDAQPFAPFALRLADGRSINVPHKEFISVHPRGRTAVVWNERGAGNIVDVMLVTNIELSPPKERSGGGNGAPSKP